MGTRTVRGLCSVERTTVLCSQEGSGTTRMIAVSGDAPLIDPVLRPGGHVCHTLSARTPPMGLQYVGLRAWIETSLHCLSSPQQLPFMGSQALTTAAGGDAILRRHAGMVRSGDSVGLRRLSMFVLFCIIFTPCFFFALCKSSLATLGEKRLH